MSSQTVLGAPLVYELPSHRTFPASLQLSLSLTRPVRYRGDRVPSSAETGTKRDKACGLDLSEGLAVHWGRRLIRGGRELRADPGSPRPGADIGGNSREHRDGRPHHAVGKAAPLYVHDASTTAAKMLLVRLGRRRRLHFRHSGRG